MIKRNWKILLFLFFIALFLRVLYLPDLAVSFAYDQGRDAFVVKELLSGDLKIQGPSVSGIPGLYHGVLYYYLLAAGYLMGVGSPLGASYLFSFLSSVNVILVYIFAYILTKKNNTALIASILYAFSFEAAQYANLLTNASMAVWFVPLSYLGVYLWLTKKANYGPILAGLGFGLSVQSEIAMGYHIVPILFWLFVYKDKVYLKQVLLFIGSIFITTFTFLLSEFKFGFTGIKGLIYLLSFKDDIAANQNLFSYLRGFISQIGQSFSYTIFPTNTYFGSFIGFLMIGATIIKNLKQKVKIAGNKFPIYLFLLSYLFAHMFGLLFGGSNMKHLTVGTVVGVCVFSAIIISEYLNNKKILYTVVALIAFSNFWKITAENKNGQTIFPLQKDLVLNKEIQIIDYTYKEAGGEPFTINTLTSPLYVNTLWSFLYSWYGKEKYGYLPGFTGHDQVGQFGNILEKMESPESPLHFYIVEPTYGIPEVYVQMSQGEEDSKSQLLDTKKIGELVVQKRLIKN